MTGFWRRYPLLFAALLTAFTVYALLDAFVIERVYARVEEAAETSPTLTATGGSAPCPAALAAGEENGAEQKPVSVSVETYRAYDTDIYVADIVTSDPTQLRTAFAENSYGRNVTAAASQTAAEVGALIAVNGDNYGARERGYVIRNGVLYRETAAKDQEDLVIWADGSFSIIRESEVTAGELLEQGAEQVFSFGPGLAENGKITVSASDEVDRAMASNPRTAIGIIAPGHYVLVVSDGRTEQSRGLSLYELAEFMTGELGVETAYNLDGGGSSTMVCAGEVVNHPVGGRNSRERAVTDIIYIG